MAEGKKTDKEKVRLSLDMSPEMNALLERLAAETGSTKSDVLRKAVALMQVAVEGKQRGLKIGLADKNQTLTTEIVGL
jgi:predicted transcriptional regulator